MRLLFSVKEAVRLLQRNRDNSAVLSVGAVDECVKELVGLSNNPLLVRPREEGWTRRQEKWREATLFGADGWSLPSHVAGMHSHNLRCERPPRLRLIHALRH